jgi:hypothetical protein
MIQTPQRDSEPRLETPKMDSEQPSVELTTSNMNGQEDQLEEIELD